MYCYIEFFLSENWAYGGYKLAAALLCRTGVMRPSHDQTFSNTKANTNCN